MGWFIYSRMHQDVLKELSLIRNKELLRLLEEQDVYPYKYLTGDVRKIEREISDSMATHGSESEKENLRLILQDLKELTPKRFTTSQRVAYYNLVRGITGLWAVGKLQQAGEDGDMYQKLIKRANPKKDPRFDELFEMADFHFSVANRRARGGQDFLLEYNSKYVVCEKGRLKLRKNIQMDDSNRKSLEAMCRNARQISYTEALRETNEAHKIIPEEEYDLKKIQIENAYKTRRSRGEKK